MRLRQQGAKGSQPSQGGAEYPEHGHRCSRYNPAGREANGAAAQGVGHANQREQRFTALEQQLLVPGNGDGVQIFQNKDQSQQACRDSKAPAPGDFRQGQSWLAEDGLKTAPN